MAIKFKNILVYILYFFIIVIGYHIILRLLNKQNDVNQNILNTQDNLVEVYGIPPYIDDAYKPRFVAPRYYDTQFIVDQQPVYTRTFGNYPMRQRFREHSHPPGYRMGTGWRGGKGRCHGDSGCR